MTKLAIQGVIALVLTAGFGIRILDVLGAPLAIILTTLWIVTLTNGFNFLDNMDGLSAGVAFLTATILAVTSFRAGQIFVPCTLMLVAGAVLGFLVFNFPPAGIFMGDAGSLVVGYMLAVLSVLITFYDPEMGRTPFGVLVPVVVFAIPLYDLISVCWHRQRSGRSIFSADRGHFSHRLVKLGMSPTLAVLTIYLATLATSLPAMLLPQLGWAGAILVFGQCLCVVTIIAILETRHER
jgi:UDP-GlcNAc:undecaprenyl-phosphate GlcNAc-1-phosphate transferase